MAEVSYTTFPVEALKAFTRAVFIRLGVPEPDAATAADVLAFADLRGIDSHGVARLRGGVADAAGGPGNQGHLAVQTVHCRPPVLLT